MSLGGHYGHRSQRWSGLVDETQVCTHRQQSSTLQGKTPARLRKEGLTKPVSPQALPGPSLPGGPWKAVAGPETREHPIQACPFHSHPHCALQSPGSERSLGSQASFAAGPSRVTNSAPRHGGNGLSTVDRGEGWISKLPFKGHPRQAWPGLPPPPSAEPSSPLCTLRLSPGPQALAPTLE